MVRITTKTSPSDVDDPKPDFCFSGVLKYSEAPKRGLTELEQHLQANQKAPRHRFMFVTISDPFNGI